MNYYFLKLKCGSLLKGEALKDLSQLGFCLLKDTKNDKIIIKTKSEIKEIPFEVNMTFDFKNSKMIISNETNKSQIRLNLIQSLFNNSPNNKEQFFKIFDETKYSDYVKMRGPIIKTIKEIIYSNIERIESSIDYTIIDSILIIKEFLNDWISYKNTFNKDYISEKLNFKNKSIKQEIDKYVNYKKNKLIFILQCICDNINNYENQSEILFNIENNSKEEFKFYIEKTNNIIHLKSIDNEIYYNSHDKQLIFNIKQENISYQVLSKDNNTSIIIDNKYYFVINTNNIFFGEMNDKLKNGFGMEYNYDSNNWFIGYYKNNTYNGKGILDNKKIIYKGEFIDGKKNGDCQIFFENNKDIYDGQIKYNVIDGEGLYCFNNENNYTNVKTYDGMFKNNKLDGRGKITYINNDTFNGEFKENIKINKGTYLNSNYDKCLMIFLNGNEVASETVYQY